MPQTAIPRAQHRNRTQVRAVTRTFGIPHWVATTLLLMALMLAALPAKAQSKPLPKPEGEVLLTVSGNIEHTNDGNLARLDAAMIAALPHQTLRTSTVVTDGVRTFEGFLMRDLLARLGAHGNTVIAEALNDYIIEVPIEDFLRFDVLVATHMDGEVLLPSDKGPFWIVYPRDAHRELQDIRYDYRWVWQLSGLEIR